MSYTRILTNDTKAELDITLYIQASSDPKKVYGTVNLRIPALTSLETTYGDLRNSFLCGIRIAVMPQECPDTYVYRVETKGDDVDRWLNGGNSLVISPERINDKEALRSLEIDALAELDT